MLAERFGSLTEDEGVEIQSKALSEGDITAPSSILGVLGSPYVLNFHPSLMTKFAFPKNRMEAMEVTYNARARRLIVLDSMGCVSWSLNAVGGGKRELEFPKQMYSVLKQIIHCSKFNVYFVLGKDCSLKVYNKDFYETFAVLNSDMKVVKSIVFNPKTDELITGGIGGVKFWKYKVNPKSTNKIVAMSNYELFLRADYPDMGGTWVKKVSLDVGSQHVFCCSLQALFCYDTEGKLLLKIPQPHRSSPSACLYSPHHKVVLTCSGDCHINKWSRKGILLHKFTGHTKVVTNLLLHPDTRAVFISSSKDGSIRFWSLDTLNELFSMSVMVEGIEWMGLTESSWLYCCSHRHCHTYAINHFTHFWNHTSSPVTHIGLGSAKGKTTRVTVLQEENNLHVMSQSQGVNLSVVLPLPIRTLMQYTYNRNRNLVFYLVEPVEIWIYTIKTNPSCRIAVWNIPEIVRHAYTPNDGKPSRRISLANDTRLSPFDESLWKVPDCACRCIASLSSRIHYPTGEGTACADSEEFLLLGLEDGRIFFVDTEVVNVPYHDIQAHEGPVIFMQSIVDQSQLISMGQDTANKCLKIWSLPKLHLLHDVIIPFSTVSLSIIGKHLCLGLECGSIIFSNFIATSSWLLPASTTTPPDFDERSDSDERQTATLTDNVFTDACPMQNIFLSCSGEAVIKVWDLQGYLLTEIVLDHTLTHAIFLNDTGDILMGFKQNLFLIPHHKLMFEVTDYTSDTSARESVIYEDPDIMDEYKGIQAQSHMDIDTYLTPFMYHDVLSDIQSLTSELLPTAEVAVTNIEASGEVLTTIMETSASPDTAQLEQVAEERSGDILQEDSSLTDLDRVPQTTSMVDFAELSETEIGTVEESRASSLEDLKKQLHPSPAAVTINRAPIAAVVNLADRFELARRGLKLDRFFIANPERARTFSLNSKDIVQPLFLNIYENKTILRKKSKKNRKSQMKPIKIPESFKSHMKIVTESEAVSSSAVSEDESTKHVQRADISVMDWLMSDMQRKESQKIVQQERATLGEERRIVHQLQRIHRQRNLPGHENCSQALSMQQVVESPVVQSEPPPLHHRLSGRIPIPSTIKFRSLFPTPVPKTRTNRIIPSMDPRYRMFVLVRETYAPPEMPIPSRLEERLLKERFPNYKLPLMKPKPQLVDRKIYGPGSIAALMPSCSKKF
ncbi:uncharacterized protein LOC129704662 isoform X2 [Leucoraja erinacea]|uniref:uncharacterized protein LOC129704662 isoform X2 n=1 Tax=Leucoraja erinaceus TaxID=7782 RepID=UPI002457C7D6|nr:uncharacterized protein LOC129704662 isoform X2 [Leucoraja erinacea]